MSMNNKSIFLEGLFELDDPFTPLSENGFSEMEPSTTTKDRTKERYPPIEDNNILDDDPNNLVDDHENDDSYECRKRNEKGHQAKNLEAERKRRKKLNDRLYSLRALVPNISKLDRGAILGDAINYIKELQTQVKDLQIELEEDSYDENSNDAMVIVRNCTDHNSMQNGPKRESGSFLIKDFYTNESFGDCGIDASRRNANETVQQMEPQVEVFQVDGNEYFVKVFNEHRHGGFVRIMEGLSSLGFQVINVNATRHTCLVSNIFTVEKSDKEIVQADHVRESLLELARNPLRTWP